MKRLQLIICISIFIQLLTIAQLKQIVVLSEGSFDFTTGQIIEPVSLGSWDPVLKKYEKKFEVAGSRFASDLILDGNSVWIAADQKVIQLNLSDWSVLNSMTVVGVRKLALYGDKLIITRGEYLTQLNSHVEIYNKTNLSKLFSIPFQLMPYTAENIIVKDSYAYITVNNGFSLGKEVGKVLKIDLDILKWVETIELGEKAKNPENLMMINDQLYSLNNRDYTGSSISSIDLSNSEVRTYELSDVSSLCGTSTLLPQQIIYQEYGETHISRFDLSSQQSGFFKEMNKPFYGMTFDPKSGWLCTGETDFFSYGHVNIYDEHLELIYDFATGIAPAYFVFHYGEASANSDLDEISFDIFPNPVNDQCKIESSKIITELELYDSYGRKLGVQNPGHLQISDLKQGIYYVKVYSNTKTGIKRLMKL